MGEENFLGEEQIAQERAFDEERVLRQPHSNAAYATSHHITCERDATVRQAIEIMQRERTDCVLVVDLGRLVGVFTDGTSSPKWRHAGSI